MTISRAIREGTKIAVFTRNYREHLDEACAISGRDPARLIPFRGVLRWTSAAQVLRRRSAIPVYFAVVGAGPLIQYAAQLEQVVPDPRRSQPETDRLLRLSTSTTRDEGL